MRTGGFMFAATEHDILIIQPVEVRYVARLGYPVPHSPDVEVLGAAGAPATTKEAESHLEIARSNGRRCRRS